MDKFYWYKSGGFELAVDAVSHVDACNFVKVYYPGRKFSYQGHYDQGTQYTSACCATTSRRQAEISANYSRFINGF